jgi:hypothetical protein
MNAILELCTKVTRKCKVTNGQTNKNFAQGVICWFHGDHLDWAKYVVYCGKYVLELKERKQPMWLGKWKLAVFMKWNKLHDHQMLGV